MQINMDSAVWRKSSWCDNSGPSCVEVAFVGGAVAVRDSKNPDQSALVFSPEEWHAFVDGAKGGEFDLP